MVGNNEKLDGSKKIVDLMNDLQAMVDKAYIAMKDNIGDYDTKHIFALHEVDKVLTVQRSFLNE